MKSSSTRDSGVPWIGRVRADWPILPAKALFKQRSTASRPDDVHLTPSQQHGVMPQAEYMALTGNQVVLNLSGADNMRHVEPGDYISHLRSFQGGLEYSAYAGKVSAAYTVLTPRKEVDPHYFRFLFKSAQYVQGLQTTTDQMRDGQSIRYGQFALLPLPNPPLVEQRRIAEFLDRETAQIDELIAKQEQLISTLAERFQSELDHLVLGHHSEDRQRLDYGRLQSIPTRWRRGRLKNVLSAPVIDGPHTTPEFVDEGHPFLSVDAIQDGELVIDSPRYVSAADFVEFRRKAAPRCGDLLMGKAASTGKIAQVKTDAQFAIWSPLALLRIDRRQANPSFVEYVLKSSPLQAAIDDYCTSNTQKNISMSDIPRLPMLLPPLPEQSEIVNRIEASRVQSSALHAKAAQVIEKLRERRQALISAAVTGQIDVGGASW